MSKKEAANKCGLPVAHVSRIMKVVEAKGYYAFVPERRDISEHEFNQI